MLGNTYICIISVGDKEYRTGFVLIINISLLIDHIADTQAKLGHLDPWCQCGKLFPLLPGQVAMQPQASKAPARAQHGQHSKHF